MMKHFMGSILGRAVVLAWGALFLFLVTGAVGTGLLLLAPEPVAPGYPGGHLEAVLAITGFIGGITAAFALLFLLRLSFFHPLAELTNRVAGLSKHDTANLAVALTIVAQGDLTTRLEVKTKPGPASGLGEVLQLSEAVNELIARFRESADGLNELTMEPLERLVYVGPDSYQEGRVAGSAVAQAMKGSGTLGIITINKGESGVLGLRIKGLLASLADRYPQIAVAGMEETFNDPDRTYTLARKQLDQNPSLS